MTSLFLFDLHKNLHPIKPLTKIIINNIRNFFIIYPQYFIMLSNNPILIIYYSFEKFNFIDYLHKMAV